jgi:hypothetical protein
VTSLGRVTAAMLVLGAFATCRPRSAPNIESLRYPIVILFANSSALLCSGPADFKEVHTNYVVLNDQPPVLIDSDFKIYALNHFRSVHGGLWLMANPSGVTEVAFDLDSKKSGLTEARRLFEQQLKKQTWRSDRSTAQESLSRSQTLLEMKRAISSEGD